MFQKSVFLALAIIPSSAFAHGSLVRQAADAVAAAATLLEQTQPREVIRKLQGVNAVRTGREQFQVTVSLSDDTSFVYQCVENEEVDPVVWDCKLAQ